MITIFAIPKPFKGHIEVIQNNAIRSWMKLDTYPEIILYAEEEGTADFASKYNIKYIPKVARNEYNTPLLDEIFKKTQEIASNDIICYVNSDIILLNDFITTVKIIASRKNKFLIVGKRWNIDIKTSINFINGWEAEIRKEVMTKGELFSHYAIDYFIFKKGSIGELPSFAVGRPGWDNWMINNARKRKIPVVDATCSITCIHQNHDYSHLKNSDDKNYAGPESLRNRELVGGFDNTYSIIDANWVIQGNRLSPQFINPMKRPINKMKMKIIMPLSRVKQTIKRSLEK